MKTPNNDKIMQALRLPMNGNKPISAQFITTTQPKKKMLIEPRKQADEFDEAGKQKIETWLSFCAIGTSLTKEQVEYVLKSGIDKGYKTTADFGENEVDELLKQLETK